MQCSGLETYQSRVHVVPCSFTFQPNENYCIKKRPTDATQEVQRIICCCCVIWHLLLGYDLHELFYFTFYGAGEYFYYCYNIVYDPSFASPCTYPISAIQTNNLEYLVWVALNCIW